VESSDVQSVEISNGAIIKCSEESCVKLVNKHVTKFDFLLYSLIRVNISTTHLIWHLPETHVSISMIICFFNYSMIMSEVCLPSHLSIFWSTRSSCWTGPRSVLCSLACWLGIPSHRNHCHYPSRPESGNKFYPSFSSYFSRQNCLRIPCNSYFQNLPGTHVSVNMIICFFSFIMNMSKICLRSDIAICVSTRSSCKSTRLQCILGVHHKKDNECTP
jgi:hypothetical protein